jgi:hypothetical protein
VTVSTRTYIPQGEIERIVAGEPKPQASNEISSSGTHAANVANSKKNAGNKRWLQDLQAELGEIARREQEEFEQDVKAGIPEAIAAKAALDALVGPAGPERQREIGTHHATWRTWWEWREARKAQQACNDHATAPITL